MEEIKTPETEVFRLNFICPFCDCRSCARIDELKPDGSFAPGVSIRCVGCKRDFVPPAPFAALIVAALNATGELRERVKELESALTRMVSAETDWEDGETGVGYRFRSIADAALKGATP